MSFWGDMAANAVGGIVTAAILGTWATRFAVGQQIRTHNERIADLEEDNRRWFRDRDAQLGLELSRLKDEHAGRGTSQSSIADGDTINRKRQALHEYRDELTAKRRRYDEMHDAEGSSPPLAATQALHAFPALRADRRTAPNARLMAALLSNR